MSNDALLWTAQPPPPRKPKPGEPVWSMRKGVKLVHCELRDDGESGCEVQMFHDAGFTYGRRASGSRRPAPGM